MGPDRATSKAMLLSLLVLALAALSLMITWRLVASIENPVFRSLSSVSAAIVGFVTGSLAFWKIAKRTSRSDATTKN
jgi:uncharacterized membrane protein YqjE